MLSSAIAGRDFDALRILLLDETGVNLEPSFGLGGPYEVQDGFVAIERPARPILANLAEQAVLDWVPLGRTWWIVCDRDVQTVLVAQLVLDAVFPCTLLPPVSATTSKCLRPGKRF